MRTPDIVVVILSLGTVLGLGLFAGRGRRGADDFFLAGRRMHWFPIGLSVMVTAFSAINYTAFAGEVSANGLYVMLSVPVFAFVSLPVTRVFMPFFHGMRLCSVYEYLETRFDVRVRCLASGLFIVWRLLWIATALFVPCKVLHVITGYNLYVLIGLAGLAATLYTSIGGMRAVMWTDVLQFFLILAGLVAALALASARLPGGFSGVLRTSGEAGLFRPFVPFDPAMFSFDPRLRITLWSAWIGTMTAFLARYGADQSVVQRYFTARSLRMAQIGFRFNVVAAVVSLCALALVGFAVHAQALDSGRLHAPGLPPIAHFAHFVRSLPYGVCGLLVAGLIAATMSSVDSGINSCAAAYTTDFHRRLVHPSPSAGTATFERILTVLLGLLATGAACFVDRFGTIFEIANKIINAFGSPLLALFLLGMFSRRANAPGMLIGGILGAAWCAFVSVSVTNLALHYYAVVNLAGTLALCYAFSLLASLAGHRPDSARLAWTWREQRARVIPEPPAEWSA